MTLKKIIKILSKKMLIIGVPSISRTDFNNDEFRNF